MFTNRTLFILGAGASKEVGLPLGVELKSKIGDKVNIAFRDGGNMVSGDDKIYETLRRISQNTPKWSNVNVLLEAGRMIHDAMPQAGSIDSYLNLHKLNPKIQLCGKLGIVQAILEAEASSTLGFDPAGRDRLNLAESSTSWFNTLWRMLHDDVPLEEVDSIFSRVEFIVFNYDRCLEQYLYHALQNTYGLTHTHADKLVRAIKIHRPYGAVGEIAWEGHGNTQYGDTRSELSSLAKNIKTFNEQITDDGLTSALSDAILVASNIVFLGFAFHSQNMKLLQAGYNAPKRVYATTMGLSANDCELIKAEIYQSMNDSGRSSMVHLEDVSCRKLMDMYFRSITRQ